MNKLSVDNKLRQRSVMSSRALHVNGRDYQGKKSPVQAREKKALATEWKKKKGGVVESMGPATGRSEWSRGGGEE